MRDADLLAEVALYLKTGKPPAHLREWADLTFKLLEQRNSFAARLGIDSETLNSRNGFDMRDFGFSDSADCCDAKTAAEDKIMEILSDNPEIMDAFPEHTGFAKTNGGLTRDFFEKNPDLVVKMSVEGKNVDTIKKEFQSAFDTLACPI